MVCIRCQKRPAIIFIQRMDNGQMKQEGYCPVSYTHLTLPTKLPV